MNNNTYKIYVENVNLAVNYYRQYLGFKLIESLPGTIYMNSARMHFHKNVLLFEKAEDVNSINNQEINFQLCFDRLQLKKLYDNFKQKTITKRIAFSDVNQINKFSIKDCDDNIISFHSIQNNY
jgi:hypothetical protein